MSVASHRFQSCKVAEMSGSIYCLNLSAAFIVQVPAYRAVLEKSLPHCDFLFGNETVSRPMGRAATELGHN